LRGLCFADKSNGVVALKSSSDESWPILYCTNDGAENWTEIKLPFEQMPKIVDYLSKVDSLIYENGVYTLTLGQDSNGKQKASFQSTTLSDGWKFTKNWTAVIHSVG
jgi:hypothetical protein